MKEALHSLYLELPVRSVKFIIPSCSNEVNIKSIGSFFLSSTSFAIEEITFLFPSTMTGYLDLLPKILNPQSAFPNLRRISAQTINSKGKIVDLPLSSSDIFLFGFSHNKLEILDGIFFYLGSESYRICLNEIVKNFPNIRRVKIHVDACDEFSFNDFPTLDDSWNRIEISPEELREFLETEMKTASTNYFSHLLDNWDWTNNKYPHITFTPYLLLLII
jgi:hypothetical protein